MEHGTPKAGTRSQHKTQDTRHKAKDRCPNFGGRQTTEDFVEPETNLLNEKTQDCRATQTESSPPSALQKNATYNTAATQHSVPEGQKLQQNQAKHVYGPVLSPRNATSTKNTTR